jgi:dipeptidyl-peptidase-4
LKHARLFLLLLSVSLSIPLEAQPAPGELTLEAIFAEGGLTGAPPSTLQWSPDGRRATFLLRDEKSGRDELWSVDAASGKLERLLSADKLVMLAPSRVEDERERRTRYSVAAYQWSPSSKELLFEAGGQMWLHRFDTGTAVQLEARGGIRDPKFSPDGTRIAYVRNHNLCVLDLARGKEKQLTSGSNGDILYGEVDWVYAEELDVRSNFFWSPDGSQIAFLQMDERPVPIYPITDFLSTHATADLQKYPKAGDPLPAVRVGVINAQGGDVYWIDLGLEAGGYIPRFGWVRDGLLWIQALNREQSRLDLYFAEAKFLGRSRRVLSESSEVWVETNNNFRLLRSGDRFLWSSWRDGFPHLYLYRFDAAKPLDAEAVVERQLTRGDFSVFEVAGVDQAGKTVYFTANHGDDRERHLYSVGLGGGGMTRITEEPGTHESLFSPDAKYSLQTFSSQQQPTRLSLCALGGDCGVFWESNKLDAYALITPVMVDFRADDGTLLHGRLLLPPGAEKAGKKVPLLLNAYGGPGGQTVRNQWGGSSYLFHQYMARNGFAVLQVDNRGMGARGRKFAAAVRRNLGSVEFVDQLAALNQALATYPFLDRDRIGFWGWSYGGYLTLMAMTHSARFAAGVAVSPVTDWRDYDATYTERYMGLPQENAEGYRRSAPQQHAADLHGKLLLVHGTSDDNVHMQNTLQMVDAFIRAGKQFDLMLYPGKTHSISGPEARVHLFRRIQEHFEKELLGGK